MSKDNYFRGTNIKERWEEKHIQQYHLDKPFDFTAFENEDMSGYGPVAAKILEENKEGFYRKSLHEMGCGNGDFVAYIKQSVLKDWEVSAEDFSEVAINSAKSKEPNVDYFTNDFLLNRLDTDYGCICMFETIEHIEEGTNYEMLDNILNHCEYAVVSTVDTEDDCFGEHISHYKIDTFEKKGYDVVWKSFLGEINMPDGIYHYMIFLIRGNLNE